VITPARRAVKEEGVASSATEPVAKALRLAMKTADRPE
jgi:hypothetical protein